MGSLRNRDFDGVIGIGGICAWARSEGINGKLNWIKIGPRKCLLNDLHGPIVTFDYSSRFEENCSEFRKIAPAMARRLLSAKAARFLFSDDFNKSEQKEVRRILQVAKARLLPRD